MSNYIPFMTAKEEALTVIREHAQDIRSYAKNAVNEKVFDNFMAVADAMDDIVNMAESFEG